MKIPSKQFCPERKKVNAHTGRRYNNCEAAEGRGEWEGPGWG